MLPSVIASTGNAAGSPCFSPLKFEHVVGFAEALPVIRVKVREHMGLRGLPRGEGISHGRALAGDNIDPHIAKVVKACQELPGQELLQYVDENSELQDVTSGDVNAYLKKITGRDITAKKTVP